MKYGDLTRLSRRVFSNKSKDSTNPGGSWWELRIEADVQTHDAISAYLFDLGCTGVITSDDNPRKLTAYLQMKIGSSDQVRAIEQYLNEIPSHFPDASTPILNLRHLEEQNWSENWKRFFKPEKVTERLSIIPPWDRPLSPLRGDYILMNPGPAFGTGKHPTTKMCLKALEKIEKPQGWDMLDVGTGSGILSIYGALLGASRIVGIDLDTEALRWAKRNARLNRVEHKIHFTSTPIKKINRQFFVVAANLVYDTICALDRELARVTSEGGHLIISGLLWDQVDLVIDKFTPKGLQLTGKDFMDEWAMVLLTR